VERRGEGAFDVIFHAPAASSRAHAAPRTFAPRLAETLALLRELKAGQAKLEAKIGLLAYSATHALTEASQKAVDGGALFYVMDREGGIPLFCGFFTSPTVALTINHDVMFHALPLPPVHAISSTGRALTFSVVSTNDELDFTVLKLLIGCSPSPAWFNLQTFASVTSGLKGVGLVTMGIGLGMELHGGLPISQHSVNVTSRDGAFFLYDGESTWRGGSGAALLFEEGLVIGMHLEVVNDKPGYVSQRATRGRKRTREGEPVEEHGASAVGRQTEPLALEDRIAAVEGDHLALEAAVEGVSVAASSQAKVCRALLLSHATVRAAVEAADVALPLVAPAMGGDGEVASEG
jgi:hypothetical protein